MKAKVANFLPYPLEVKKGKTLYWCACGESRNQPFCDGSHKGTGFEPVAFTPSRDKIIFFCGCKQTSNGPVCDGSHGRLAKPEQNTDKNKG